MSEKITPQESRFNKGELVYFSEFRPSTGNQVGGLVIKSAMVNQDQLIHGKIDARNEISSSTTSIYRLDPNRAFTHSQLQNVLRGDALQESIDIENIDIDEPNSDAAVRLFSAFIIRDLEQHLRRVNAQNHS